MQDTKKYWKGQLKFTFHFKDKSFNSWTCFPYATLISTFINRSFYCFRFPLNVFPFYCFSETIFSLSFFPLDLTLNSLTKAWCSLRRRIKKSCGCTSSSTQLFEFPKRYDGEKKAGSRNTHVGAETLMLEERKGMLL